MRSAARLAKVWAEEDAEIAAKLGEGNPVNYRFACKHCRSKFSLAQQLESHEVECARIGAAEVEQAVPAGSEVEMADPRRAKMLHCRRCGDAFPNIKDLNAHVMASHGEERRAVMSAALKRYHDDQKKIDATIAGDGNEGVSVRPPESPRRSAPRAHGNGNGRKAAAEIREAGGTAATKNGGTGGAPRCPLCDGPLPLTTAELVSQLTQAGLAEAQAFEAAKIARRVLGAGAPA